MSTVIKAPESLVFDYRTSVFLAGSIAGGTAQNWQDRIIESLSNEEVVLVNPRRNSWDKSWKQDIDSIQFNEQVNWELEALEKSDIIVMYFDASTKSPISLLELGLFAKSQKLIVCCPDGFWRKGNVDIVCARYGIQQVEELEDLVNEIRKKIK